MGRSVLNCELSGGKSQFRVRSEPRRPGWVIAVLFSLTIYSHLESVALGVAVISGSLLVNDPSFLWLGMDTLPNAELPKPTS